MMINNYNELVLLGRGLYRNHFVPSHPVPSWFFHFFWTSTVINLKLEIYFKRHKCHQAVFSSLQCILLKLYIIFKYLFTFISLKQDTSIKVKCMLMFKCKFLMQTLITLYFILIKLCPFLAHLSAAYGPFSGVALHQHLLQTVSPEP